MKLSAWELLYLFQRNASSRASSSDLVHTESTARTNGRVMIDLSLEANSEPAVKLVSIAACVCSPTHALISKRGRHDVR